MMPSINEAQAAAILFVEDNEDLRDNAALVLGLEGYTVRVARDGLEALDVLEAGFSPNLIVSDIMMPRMDGYEFFEAVRQQPHLRGVPFIFLTARGSRQDVSQGRMMGADDYLVKPFDPEEFLIAVQSKLQRVREMREQAVESLNDARRSLVQLLSHELRTPLTYVTGGFALLAEELQEQQNSLPNEDVRLSLDLIQSGTQRLNRLAEQMVLYSEILSGFVQQQMATSGEYLELPFLISDALALLGDISAEHGARFEQELPDDQTIVAIYGLKDLLVTALSEVIRNAIQHSPPGTPIRISVGETDGQGWVRVVDRGPGIEPHLQEKIWRIMVQSARDDNTQQGVGMGLPIVKGIVEAHKGEITLSSTPGRGTEVTVRIPAAPASAL